MKIVKADEEGLRIARQALESGGMIVYPTETLYGLGVDVANSVAVEKIWQFKGERGDKPVLVAVADKEMMYRYIEVDSLIDKICDQYLPGSVSVVGKDKELVNDKVSGGTGSLGMRIPDVKWTLKLIVELGRGISSTSVNLSGEEPIRSLEDFYERILAEKQRLVDVFVDVGEMAESLPSTVVGVENGELKIYRQGRVRVEMSNFKSILK